MSLDALMIILVAFSHIFSMYLTLFLLLLFFFLCCPPLLFFLLFHSFLSVFPLSLIPEVTKAPGLHYRMSLPFHALCSCMVEALKGGMKFTFLASTGSSKFTLLCYYQMIVKRNEFSLKAPIFNGINHGHILL